VGKGASGSLEEGREVVSLRRSEDGLREVVLSTGEVEAGSAGRDRMAEEMCAFREARRDFVSSIEASRESMSARVRAVGASGRASRMLEVASVGSLASAAVSCGESLFDAFVPANGGLSFSEAKVRNAFFLDDFERALRPSRWLVFAGDIESWSLLTMPRAELSDYHD
jgi:hypothetical protein